MGLKLTVPAAPDGPLLRNVFIALSQYEQEWSCNVGLSRRPVREMS
jgi:hypothetical protein